MHKIRKAIVNTDKLYPQQEIPNFFLLTEFWWEKMFLLGINILIQYCIIFKVQFISLTLLSNSQIKLILNNVTGREELLV